MAEAQGAAVAELTVPIRGDLTPLRNDLAAARRELEAFNKTAGVGGGPSAGASSGAAGMARDLSAANDNAKKLAASFTQMGGSATASFAKTTSGFEAMSGAISTATMDFGQFNVAARTLGSTLPQVENQVEHFNQSLGAADVYMRNFIDRTTGAAGAMKEWSGPLGNMSQELENLRGKFNPIFAASKQYETSLNEIDRALKLEAISAGEAERAIAALNAQYTMAGKQTLATAQATEKLGGVSKNAAWQSRNLSFQLLDTSQSLALGMPALQVLLQQGPQIAQIYSSKEGGIGRAFQESGKQILGLLTKFPLLTLAAGGAIATFVNMHNEIEKGGHKLITYGDIFSGLTKTLWDYGKSAATNNGEWSNSISDAWDRVKTQAEALTNALIKSFTFVYTSIKYIFNSLSDVVAVGISAATNGVIDGINFMVSMAVKSLNLISSTMDGLLSKIPGYDKRIHGGFNQIDPNAGQITDRADTGANVDRMKDRFAKYKSDISDIATSNPAGDFYDAWKENSVEAMNERLKKKGGRSRKTKEDSYQKIITDANQFIATQEREAAALGMSEDAAAKLKYEQELLDKAADAHIKLTDKQTAELKGLADQMAQAEVYTKRLTEAYNLGKDTFKGVFTDIQSGLQNGSSLFEAFGNAATNALQKIADKVLDMALNGIWDQIWNGGGSSLIGSLLGGSAGAIAGTSSTSSWATGLLDFHASGTDYANAGWSVVGEKGPELMKVPGGSQIVANNRVNVPGMQSFGGAANSNVPPQINVNIFSPTGNSEIKQMVADGVTSGLKQYDKHTLPESVARVNAKPRMRGG